MDVIYWGLACLVVLAVIVARAMRNAPEMPEWMAAADEDWSLIYQESIITQRPAGDRYKDMGGQA
jgi:hypothetical protein